MVRAGQRRHDAGNEQCQGRVKIDRPPAREPDRENRHRQRQQHVLEDVEQAVCFSKPFVEPLGGDTKLAQQNARILEYALAPAGLDIGNAQQDLAAAKFDVKLALAVIRRREQKLHADVSSSARECGSVTFQHSGPSSSVLFPALIARALIFLEVVGSPGLKSTSASTRALRIPLEMARGVYASRHWVRTLGI